MSLYDAAQALAGRMLRQFGEAAVIRRPSVADDGPTDPVALTETTTDHACRVAVFPVDQRDIDGTTIKAGDFRALVAAEGLAIEPATTDRLVCSAGALAIVDAGRFAPAGTVTHYRMVCRK